MPTKLVTDQTDHPVFHATISSKVEGLGAVSVVVIQRISPLAPVRVGEKVHVGAQEVLVRFVPFELRRKDPSHVDSVPAVEGGHHILVGTNPNFVPELKATKV